MTNTETLAQTFESATATEYAQTLHMVGRRRVVLVAESLIALYNGRRYALQSAEDSAIWKTEAIIHSAKTAAEWISLED